MVFSSSSLCKEYNFIMHGPYVRQMIPEPGDPDREVPVAETFHEHTNDELTEKEEIWLRVQQMMKGSDIGIQEKRLSYPTTAMNMTLVLMAKPFKLNYSTPTNNNQRISSNPHNRQIAQPGFANLNANQNGNGNVVAARAEGNGNGNNGNQIWCYNCRGLGHLVKNCTVKSRRRDLDEIEEVNANCILIANLQQASTSGTQTDKAPVYDSDGSAEVHHSENCYNNDIFNMFTQEEQYTEQLEPIPEPHQVQHNDSNVISAVSNVKQSRGTVEQHPATAEETCAL
ncbi:retrovirus-related pol polyprotein from transposon TNT 1-94 [Tanacetum coccineum]